MVISSRTPEGSFNRCPLCDGEICIEPSRSTGDAPCPNCGHLLWFSNAPAGFQSYDFQIVSPYQERIVELLCDNLGINRSALTSTTLLGDLGADSLDMVELIMASEEEFGTNVPAEEAEHIRTVGDLVDFFFRHRP